MELLETDSVAVEEWTPPKILPMNSVTDYPSREGPLPLKMLSQIDEVLVTRR